MPEWLLITLLVAWPVYLVVMAFWIIMQRSEPVATLGWIMALAFLPYLGFLIYYVFGPQQIKRSGKKRLASHTKIGVRGKTAANSEASVVKARKGSAMRV